MKKLLIVFRLNKHFLILFGLIFMLFAQIASVFAFENTNMAHFRGIGEDESDSVANYSVVHLEYLSQENVIGTVSDLRNFDPAHPTRGVAVGGSFSDFVPFGTGTGSFNHAVIYNSDGGIKDINELVSSDAHDMNARGVVVGFGSLSGIGNYSAWKYEDGKMIILGGTNATAVNDEGVVVGYHAPGGYGTGKAIYWTPDNVQQQLNPSAESELYDINNHYDVVGYIDIGSGNYALVQNLGNPNPTLLPIPDGMASCSANSINDNGDIVGICSKSGAYQPVLWTDGGATALEVLPNEGTGGGRANDINMNGQIVGNSNWGKAILWEDGQIYDLNELTPDYPFFLTNAVAINDQGVIACHTSNGATTAVLLIPQTQ